MIGKIGRTLLLASLAALSMAAVVAPAVLATDGGPGG
jgi:hypothetical protein